jgi:uncharacterized protein YecT (DUF1311 family)
MALAISTGLVCLVACSSLGVDATVMKPLQPPVIAEHFASLPCNQQTTVGMEGCGEREVLTADKRIDGEVGVLFKLLFNNAARQRLITAEAAWLTYRNADCLSQADIYEGGTQANVEYVACLVVEDKARSADLDLFYKGLVQGRDHPPHFP